MNEELEILKSIYFDDISNINLDNERPSFEVLISPADSNEADKRKSLILKLCIVFAKTYPDEIPEFSFKNVRGITDEDVKKIHSEIIEIANRNIGNCMLFEIIQHIRDFLSECGQVPKSCKCSICLSEFEQQNGQMIHLDCYHYFHKLCLLKHVDYVKEDIEREKQDAQFHKIVWKERKIFCPECREPIGDALLDELQHIDRSVLGPLADEFNEKIVISDKMRRLQAKMKTLYDRQKLRGGIIENKEPEVIVLNRPANNNENENTNAQATNNF